MRASAASARPPFAAGRETLGAVVLAVVVVLAYAPTLSNELVWDDLLHIVDNQHVRSLGAARVYLERSEGAYFRPLVFLGYAMEHATWGTAALGYHLVNLLLHLANVFLLRGVALRSGASGAAALLAAAIFALHPVQTEAVAYVSGRTDLLMTAGALLSWAALLASGPLLLRGIGAALAGGVAMLSKESGFALALLWPWLAWRHGRDGRERLTLIGPGMLLALLLLALRPGDLLLPGLTKGVNGLAAVGQALAVYAGVLIWPQDLQIDRLTPLPDGGLALAVGFAALGAGVALAIWGLTRRGPVADWSAWTIAFYLPVANLLALYPAIADRVLFTPEHNLYAPLAGLAVLIGMGIERLQPQWHRVARVTAVAVLALWAVRAAARCTTWHDEERLFGDAVAAGSPSPRVWYNYGNTLLERGAEVAAAEAYAGAAERAPRDPAIWSNLGVAYQRQRAYDAAERAYRRAAELAPGDAQIYENLGILFVARGDLPAAREAFATAVRLDPQRSTSRRALAALQEHHHDD